MTTYQIPMFSVSRIREEAPTVIETSSNAVSASSTIISCINQVVDAFVAKCSEAQLKKLGKRIERARLLAEAGTYVLFTEDPEAFKVRSVSTKGEYYYKVNVASKNCNCPDHAEQGNICKHILAAYFTKKAYELNQFQANEQQVQEVEEQPPVPVAEQPVPVAEQPVPVPVPAPQPDPAGSEIEKILAARALFEPVVYGMLAYGSKRIPVQILATDRINRLAHVQALPQVSAHGDPIPVFPFPSGPGSNCVMYSTTDVSFNNLSSVRVYYPNHKGKKGE